MQLKIILTSWKWFTHIRLFQMRFACEYKTSLKKKKNTAFTKTRTRLLFKTSWGGVSYGSQCLRTLSLFMSVADPVSENVWAWACLLDSCNLAACGHWWHLYVHFQDMLGKPSRKMFWYGQKWGFLQASEEMNKWSDRREKEATAESLCCKLSYPFTDQ